MYYKLEISIEIFRSVLLNFNRKFGSVFNLF